MTPSLIGKDGYQQQILFHPFTGFRIFSYKNPTDIYVHHVYKECEKRRLDEFIGVLHLHSPKLSTACETQPNNCTQWLIAKLVCDQE